MADESTGKVGEIMANNEVKVTFKAFNKEFNSAIKGMNSEAKKLRQEMKLQQEQMKHTGSSTDKLKAQLTNLEKQYQVAQQRTQATAEQLEKARQKWGENSDEAAKLETQLRSNQITEQQLANKIAETSSKLNEAEQAERARLSETAKASQKLDELKTKEDQLKGSTEKLNAEYELQKAQLGDNAKETDKLKLKLDHLGKQHDLAKAQVQNYEEQLEQAKKKYGENSVEVDKYEVQLLEARTAEQQLANEIESTNKTLTEQSNAFKNASKKLDDMGKKMRDRGKDLTTKVTAPILALGAGALKVGMDFEYAMSNVQAISGATGRDFEVLTDKAREMGAKTSKSASEAADALGYMALAGWDTQQMLGGIEPILRLSEAGAIDLGRASDLVTDSMAALQLEVKDLPTYLDKVAQTARKSNTDIDALMEAFLISGGTFANFNVPVEEASSLLGVLANRGFKASEAGTAMNAIVTNLTSGTGAAGKALKKLGISAFDSNKEFKGMEVVLNEVRVKMSKMNDQQRAQYIAMIAGKEHMKTFNALMAGLGDEYGDLKDDIEASNGALNEMANTMKNNTKGKVEAFKSALEEVGIAFSQYIIPYATKGTEKLTEVTQKFGELDDKTKKTILTIAGVAAAAGPVLFISGTLASSLGALAGGFALLTGPIGLTVAGLAAVGAGAAYTAIELSKPAIEADIFGNKVSEATEKAVGAFLDLEKKASNSLKQLSWSGQTVTKEMADEIVGNFAAMKDAIVSKLEEQKNESLASLQELFAGSKELSDKEKQHLLESTEKSFEERIVVTEKGQARIDEIIRKAAEENRENTQKEMDEINRIQQEMHDIGIMILSESEADQLVIMERLKTESSKLSAEQAAEIIKSSIEQRDKTIQAAEEAYDNAIKVAILKRKEGTKEANEEADLIIEAATRQRDEAVAQAEGMHADVVAEAKKQAGEHVKVVNEYTGEIMSKYDVMTKDVNVKVLTMGIKASRDLKSMAVNGVKSFRDLRRGTASELVGMYQKTNITFENTRRAAVRKFVEIQNAIIKPIKIAKAAVETALDQLKSKFDNLKLKIPTPSLPKLPKFSLATNSKTVMGKSITYPTGFNVNWNAKGGIFTKPTIFNTANAGLQGVGEAGPEAILPLSDNVLGKIGEMIANTMTTNNHSSVVIYATVRDDQDIDKLANKIDGKLNTVGDRRNAAWGG